MRRLKQIEEYKKMISDAFIKLLQDKSMDEITISQIAQEAQIGRNTFYSHFKKKEDILDYLLNSILTTVQYEFSQKPHVNIRDFLIWRFTFIKTNPLMTVVQKEDDLKKMIFRFRENNLSLFKFTAQEDIYKMEFFQGGLDYVTSRWIIGKMKESPEEMADKILSLMN